MKAFYVWYLTGLIAEPQFPKKLKDRLRLRQELTESLANELKKLREETNADPLICAQDFFGEWIGAMEVKPLRPSTVLVIFGPPPTKLHRIEVTLREEGGVWKVDRVERPRPVERK